MLTRVNIQRRFVSTQTATAHNCFVDYPCTSIHCRATQLSEHAPSHLSLSATARLCARTQANRPVTALYCCSQSLGTDIADASESRTGQVCDNLQKTPTHTAKTAVNYLFVYFLQHSSYSAKYLNRIRAGKHPLNANIAIGACSRIVLLHSVIYIYGPSNVKIPADFECATNARHHPCFRSTVSLISSCIVVVPKFEFFGPAVPLQRATVAFIVSYMSRACENKQRNNCKNDATLMTDEVDNFQKY